MARTKEKKPLQKAEKAKSKDREGKKKDANGVKKTKKTKTTDTPTKVRWSKVKGMKVKPIPAQRADQQQIGNKNEDKKRNYSYEPALDIVADRFHRSKGIRRLTLLSRKMEGAQKIRFIAEATVFTGSVVVVDDPAPRIAAGDEHPEDDKNGILVVATTSHTTLSAAPLLSIKPCSARIYVKPLIIFDLNGVLCHRIRDETLPADVYRQGLSRPIAGTTIIPRPSLTSFLNHAFENFVIGIWTSAKEKTARELVSSLIPEEQQSKLLFVWHQDDCQSRWSRNSGTKEPVYHKNILKVWESFPLWNAQNTLLVDDSPGKSTQATRMNVVNPPSLNGRAILQHRTEAAPVLDDHVNVEKQSAFFTALADLWKSNCTVEHWESGIDLAVSLRLGGLYNFLSDQRDGGHMAWESGYFLGCEGYEDNS
jgi:NLI interacting factor-like phosphatase